MVPIDKVQHVEYRSALPGLWLTPVRKYRKQDPIVVLVTNTNILGPSCHIIFGEWPRRHLLHPKKMYQ